MITYSDCRSTIHQGPSSFSVVEVQVPCKESEFLFPSTAFVAHLAAEIELCQAGLPFDRFTGLCLSLVVASLGGSDSFQPVPAIKIIKRLFPNNKNHFSCTQ